MPLDRIYVTRHGHRLNWSIDLDTGTYYTTFPTPTGIPVDPILTAAGITQSHELAAHLSSPGFSPRPCRVYSSPFYRCLQTIQPSVEALKKIQGTENRGDVELDVRMENGIAEWFGSSSSFTHPSPPTPDILQVHFPCILPPPTSSKTPYTPHIIPSPHGETISELHDRIATTLEAIIADVDAELAEYEKDNPQHANESRSIIICTHAAPLIAMGRALTGHMPEDSSTEDFRPFVASLSTFVRRRGGSGISTSTSSSSPSTVSGREIPDWRMGRGVGGGWDCVGNGECGFLSRGEERGWHFHGEEDFNSMPTPITTSSTVDDSSKL